MHAAAGRLLAAVFCAAFAALPAAERCAPDLATATRGATTPPPNFVFILADDLGYMDIGSNNPETFYETPHIDALARRGMRFTQGYAACGVCSPTRGSIMTGKYPPRFGITDFIPGMRSEKMRSAPNASQLPLAEITIAEALRTGGYSTFFAGKWYLGGGQFYPGAQGFPEALEGSAQFWYPKSHTPPPHKNDDPKTTERLVNEAVAFIDAHAQTPFYAYLPFLALHTPIGARGDLVAKYEKKKMSAPPDAWGQERARQVRLVQNNALSTAMLEHLDTGIGRILATLEKNGLTEKTIVVFMSDNGGLATSEGHPRANLPLRAGKRWPYGGGIRVPWIICAPGITPPGSTCPTPVISTDFYPTLLIRAGDWKLIEGYENGALELYHIPADHREKNNLAAREARPHEIPAGRPRHVASICRRHYAHPPPRLRPRGATLVRRREKNRKK